MVAKGLHRSKTVSDDLLWYQEAIVALKELKWSLDSYRGVGKQQAHTCSRRTLNDNVEIPLVHIMEYVRQFVYRTLKRCSVNKVEAFEILLETTVGGKGDLPENKGVRFNVLECFRLLLTYLFLEGSDSLFIDNFDSKEAASVIAEDQTIESERMGSGYIGRGWEGR
jgi:hypothetical protein